MLKEHGKVSKMNKNNMHKYQGYSTLWVTNFDYANTLYINWINNITSLTCWHTRNIYTKHNLCIECIKITSIYTKTCHNNNRVAKSSRNTIYNIISINKSMWLKCCLNRKYTMFIQQIILGILLIKIPKTFEQR